MTSTFDMGNDTSDSINIFTFKDVKHNGVIYKPEFETDGLKIPVVYVSGQNGSDIESKCAYLMIPKEVLMDMLREYIPTIIRELKSSTDDSIIELLKFN